MHRFLFAKNIGIMLNLTNYILYLLKLTMLSILLIILWETKFKFIEVYERNIIKKKVEVVVMDSYPEPSSYSNYVNNRYRAIATI